MQPIQAQPAQAVGITTTRASDLLATGRTQLLNFRLYKAERTFRALAREPDGEAAAHYHLATSSLLKALVTDETVYFAELSARSDSLQAVLESIPASHWRTFLMAEAYFHRTMALAKEDHFIRAALAARQAYKRYEDIMEADPAFYEAYVGMGLMHILIGTLPGAYRSLLKVLGYSGSLTRGQRELQQAVQHGALNADEAAIYLAMVDVMLNNSKGNGVQTLRALQARYPESALCNHLYGYVLLENRRAEEARTFLEKAVQAGTSADYFYIDYADFYLAEATFRLRQWQQAEVHYRRYLQRHRGTALKALGYLELGQALEMQGQRDAAVEAYQKVQAERAYDSDKVAYHRAQRLLAAPMTAQDRQLLEGINAYLAGQYDQAEATLTAIAKDPAFPEDLRTVATYHLGRLYHALGLLDHAMEAYRYVAQHPVADREARWEPWSHFFIGEVYAEQGQPQRARAAFEQALSFKGPFDYHQALEQQAKAALARL
ncbi:MAG TPA: tetratricopeptide repeat protein [Rhodothermales bacterium]|nr:tetratricopeptide repeat protein [Rhodothermales bacterium]